MAVQPQVATLVFDWISKNCPRLVQCTGCNANDWNLEDMMVGLLAANHTPGAPMQVVAVGPAPIFPMVCVKCRRCGYLFFLSAQSIPGVC